MSWRSSTSIHIAAGPANDCAPNAAGTARGAPVVLYGDDWARWLDTETDVTNLLGAESPDRFNIAKCYILGCVNLFPKYHPRNRINHVALFQLK